MTFEALNILDHVRKSFNSATPRTDRSQIGQFLTPAEIARFIASMFETEIQQIKILGFGAGAGVLFVA